MSTSISFKRLVGRGAAWTTLDVVIGRLGSFITGIVVARILAPEAFGVFAVALVVHAVVVNVSELGVSAALIRDDRDTAVRSAPTVATISLVNSALLAVLMAGLSPVLARVLGSPAAAGPIAIMALMLPLAGITAVPAAFLRRDFRMDRIFLANIANLAVTTVVVISLAVAGWGPMALAWSWVLSQAVSSAVLLTYRPGRFWPGWDGAEARRLLRFGLPLAGANLLVFSVLNVDYLIIGHVLGAEMVGLYMLAFNISGWPMNVFGSVIRSVSLPGFSKLRLDGASMPTQFTKAIRGVAALTLPICFILGALAQPAIDAVYGSDWSAAAAALIGLSVLGGARILLELCGDYLVALGRTRAILVAQVPWLISLTVGLLLVVPMHGIGGAGAVQAVVAIGIMAPVYLWFLSRSGVHAPAVIRAVALPAAWALFAAVIAHVVADRFENNFVACAVGGAAGLLVAAAPYLPQILRIARSARPRRRKESSVVTTTDQQVAVGGVVE